MKKQDNQSTDSASDLSAASGSAYRDLGDGVPVRVSRCPMCGITPSAPDDCGMPTPECPNFGKDACARKRKLWEDTWQNAQADS
tara:strand:+ start:33 stop:284 length:252 start_codon:yes stop_codon:yes gene_type:complete